MLSLPMAEKFLRRYSGSRGFYEQPQKSVHGGN